MIRGKALAMALKWGNTKSVEYRLLMRTGKRQGARGKRGNSQEIDSYLEQRDQ